MTVSEQAQVSARITLRNLIAARWVLIALVSAGVFVIAVAEDRLPAGLLPNSDHPVLVLVVLALWTALNLGSTLALRRERASEPLAGAHLLIDALTLTALLALSGGPANPFTILYFVPITLATQISPRWTWVLAGVCVAGFAALFLVVGVDRPAPAPEPPAMVEAHHQDHAHHQPPPPQHQGPSSPHAEHFEGHQQGMWIALCIVGVLITVFVHRTALALARQRDELGRLRQTSLEDRHLTALGTLAAGAAHELGTPLGTIKLLVDELPHLETKERGEALTTIQDQLARCKLIVSRMASPELRVSTLGAGQAWTLEHLAQELEGVELGVPLTIELPAALAGRSCDQPFEALTQLLRELLHNADEACQHTHEPGRGIEVDVDVRAETLRIEVRDQGVGMDAETRAAAFDPFLSTRPEGSGMGMGLYLARAHLRQLGGTITLDSQPGRGTTVHVALPLAAKPLS